MAAAKQIPWVSCGYAEPCCAPELASGGAPVASMRAELSTWLVRSAMWLQRAVDYLCINKNSIDARAQKNAIDVLAVLQHFKVERWALKDGRMFCCFTQAQLLSALGWRETRYTSALRALHLLALAPTDAKADDRLREQCRELREAGFEPVIELVQTGAKGSHGSVYAFVGIDSVPLEVPGNAVDERAEDVDVVSVTSDIENDAGGTLPRLVDAEQKASLSVRQQEPTAECAPPNPSVTVGAQVSMTSPEPRRTFREARRPAALAMDPLSQSIGPVFSEEEECCYQRMVDAFPKKPGVRDAETRVAFRARIDSGWEAEAIAEGALRYRADGYRPPDGNDRWEYPLKWLESDNHFKSVVARAPKAQKTPHELALGAVLRKYVGDGHHGPSWSAIGAIDNEAVDLYWAGDCCEEEARIYLEAEIMRRNGCPEIEVDRVLDAVSDEYAVDNAVIECIGADSWAA